MKVSKMYKKERHYINLDDPMTLIAGLSPIDAVKYDWGESKHV